jgi:HlyD family secretion protein
MRTILKQWGLQRPAVFGVGIALLGGVGILGAVRLTSRPPGIPTIEVKRGEFVDSMTMRGEVKALRSLSIAAPAEAGELLIVKIAADGDTVKKDDVIVEFDKTRTQQDLAQYKSALKSAQAEIDQAHAQGRLTDEADVTAVSKAKYELESSRLEAGKQEIVSAIEGEKARLKVADAEQKLREAEQKLKSDQSAARAAAEGKIQASKKSVFDMQRAERALGRMTLRAPQGGVVSLVQSWRPEGPSVFKPGDRAWPGALVAELPDLATLRVSARVDETERGRIRVGQSVNVQCEAIPDRQFTGHIDQISAIASTDFSAGWPFPKNFTVQVALDQNDGRIKPGMSAQISILVDTVANALTIPAQAAFQKSGRTVAYILQGSKFEERTITVARRSGERVLVANGLQAGDRIALQRPAGLE